MPPPPPPPIKLVRPPSLFSAHVWTIDSNWKLGTQFGVAEANASDVTEADGKFSEEEEEAEESVAGV